MDQAVVLEALEDPVDADRVDVLAGRVQKILDLVGGECCGGLLQQLHDPAARLGDAVPAGLQDGQGALGVGGHGYFLASEYSRGPAGGGLRPSRLNPGRWKTKIRLAAQVCGVRR
ncbi:hypothetical protein D3C86_1910190 [compost metagenome]